MAQRRSTSLPPEFRSRWLTANLTLFLLRSLRDGSKTLGELARTHERRTGISLQPEVAKATRVLLRERLATRTSEGTDKRFRITLLGMKVLSGCESEYLEVVSRATT